jgi:hypothetical protein
MFKTLGAPTRRAIVANINFEDIRADDKPGSGGQDEFYRIYVRH